MRKQLLSTIIIAAAGLAGCTSDRVDLYHTDFDPHTRARWTGIVGPMDMAGGPRQTLLCKADMYGNVEHCWDTNGPGTLQGFMAGGFGGLMQGAGFAGGMALLRPSNTNVSNNNTTSGGSIAPGAASATASPVVAGGAGGMGGAGGRGGTGGNAAGGNATAAGGQGGNASGGQVGNVSASSNQSVRASSSSQSSAAAASGRNAIGSADSNKCVGGTGCTNN